MTTPSGNDNVIIDILAKLNIDTTEAQRKINEMMDKVSGGAGRMVAGAAGAVGMGGGGANEQGQVKQADERSKVRTAALSKLAQQFPGGGLMTTMAAAFKGGGMMAGVATGISAAVGILTNIMKSSQVFQTLSGTVFKVLGFMADMFLMPFVPMMMKFVTWMLTNMPAIMSAGEKTAAAVEGIWNFFTFFGRQEKAGKEKGGVEGWFQEKMGAAFSTSNILKSGFYALTGQHHKMIGMQQGGLVPGGPGEEKPTMLHGGEMVVPQDIAAGAKGMSGRVAAWITRFQQKEMGPSGVMGKWYDQMFGHSIIPEIWSNIRGLMVSIEGEARSAGENVASDTSSMEEDNKSFWDKFKFWEYFTGPWEKVKEFFGGLGEKLKNLLPDMPDISLPSIPAMPDISLPDVDWGALWSSMGDIKDKVQNFFSGLWNKVSGETDTDLGQDLGWIDTSGPSLWERMKGWASSVGKWFYDPGFTGGLVWGALQLYDYSGLDSVVSWSFGAFNFIKDCFLRAKDAVSGFFTSTVPGWAMSAASSIGRAVSGVGAFLGTVGDIVGTYIKSAWNTVKWFFQYDMPTWIWGQVQNVRDWISDHLPSFMNVGSWIGSALTGVYNTVKDTIIGWGSSILNWRPFGQFGNLQSGYLYPSAVKKVVPLPPVEDYVYDDIGEDLGGGDGGKGGDGGDAGGKGGDAGGKGGQGSDSVGKGSGVQGGGWGSAPGGGSMGIHATAPGSDLATVQAAEATSAQDAINSFDYGGSNFYDYADEGWAFGNIGGGSRRASRRASRIMRIDSGPRYNNRSTRILNVNIQSSLSVVDIVNDIDRLETMNEASFFNGVM